jgi:hypothetical protein
MPTHVFRVEIEGHGPEEVALQATTREAAKSKLLDLFDQLQLRLKRENVMVENKVRLRIERRLKWSAEILTCERDHDGWFARAEFYDAKLERGAVHDYSGMDCEAAVLTLACNWLWAMAGPCTDCGGHTRRLNVQAQLQAHARQLVPDWSPPGDF